MVGPKAAKLKTQAPKKTPTIRSGLSSYHSVNHQYRLMSA
ncbi:hypothetical protein EMIT0P260_140022 [Pseudomonas sp. IT-P260]